MNATVARAICWVGVCVLGVSALGGCVARGANQREPRERLAALRQRQGGDPWDGEAALAAGRLLVLHRGPLGDPEADLARAALAPGLRGEALLLAAYSATQRGDVLAQFAATRALVAAAPSSVHAAAAALLLERAEPELAGWAGPHHRRWLRDALSSPRLHGEARRSLLRQLWRSCARAKAPRCAEWALREQGYLRDWTAHGPLGLTPTGSLRRPLGSLPTPERRGCSTPRQPGPSDLVCSHPVFAWDGHLRCPTWSDSGGTCLLTTRVLVRETGPAELGVRTDDALRVEVDGRLVLQHDPLSAGDRGRERGVRLHLERGWHSVRVALTADGWQHGARVWLLDERQRPAAQRTDAVAREVAATTVRVRSPWIMEASAEPPSLRWASSLAATGELLGLLMQATLLGPGGQHDPLTRLLAAERLAGAHPLSAEAAYLHADSLLHAPGLTPGARQSRARTTFERAVRLDPGHVRARLGLARLAAAAEAPALALEHLAAGLASEPDHPWALLERFRAQRALGRDLEAAASLERSLARGPWPPAQREAADWQGELRALEERDAARARLLRLVPSLVPRERAWWAEEAGDPAAAAAIWEARGRYATQDTQATAEAARLCAATGDADGFERALLEWRARAPGDPELAVAEARARIHAEGPAAGRPLLYAAVLRKPSDLGLHRLLAEIDGHPLGQADPLCPQTWARPPAGAQAGSVTQPGSLEDEQPQDREVLWQHRRDVILGPRGGYRLVHRALRVHTQAAGDDLGELRLPDDARLLELRTVEPDGRVWNAELGQGKEDLSFSGLSVGDVIELRYVVPLTATVPGGGVADRFFFQLPDAPLKAGLLEVCRPPEVPLTVWSSPGAPPPDPTERPGPIGTICRRWVVRSAPALSPEPEHTPLGEWLPWVTYGVGVESVAERLAAVASDHLLRNGRGDAAVRAAARAWSPPEGGISSTARARRLFERLCAEVESSGREADLAPGAGQTLAAGRGNRTVLLVALLTAAEIPHRVLLADDLRAEQGSLPPGLLRGFQHPLVEVQQEHGGPALLLSAAEGLATVGAPAPPLRGAPALVLTGACEGTVVTLPRTPERPQPDWEIHLQLALAAQTGGASGSLTVLARGPGSRTLRRLMREVAESELAAKMERALAPAFPPGLRIQTLSHSGAGADSGALELRAEVSWPRLARSVGPGRVTVGPLLSGALGPLLGAPAPSLRDYLARPHRRSPLLLQPLHERQHVELLSPGAPLPPLRLPPTGDVSVAGLRYAQGVTPRPGGYRLQRSIQTELRRVPPGAFPSLRAALLRARELSQGTAELAIGGASASGAAGQ